MNAHAILTDEGRSTSIASQLHRARSAQPAWAATDIAEKIKIIRKTRHLIANEGKQFVEAIRSARAFSSSAEIVASELIPLCDACKFVERNVARLLKGRRYGISGRPAWLFGVDLEVVREPHGVVLVIAPSNYPLFLAGVQVMQAIAAGNCVLWKPGMNGAEAARLLLNKFQSAGLPEGVIMLLDEEPASAAIAIDCGVDKVFLTGSAETGRAVASTLASTITPAVMELSGSDVALILSGADLQRAAKALRFGLTLNGSSTCIRPHRVIVDESIAKVFEAELMRQLSSLEPIRISKNNQRSLSAIIQDAVRKGASEICGEFVEHSESVQPFVIRNVTPSMLIWDADVFAPVLTITTCGSEDDAVSICNQSKYALSASVFGPKASAANVARKLNVGVVTINDLVVPTADPRLPFGGRKLSGHGVTRGAEGLLEMTRTKSISTRTRRWAPHLEASHAEDEELMLSALLATHSGDLVCRARGIVNAIAAGIRRGSASQKTKILNQREKESCR